MNEFQGTKASNPDLHGSVPVKNGICGSGSALEMQILDSSPPVIELTEVKKHQYLFLNLFKLFNTTFNE